MMLEDAKEHMSLMVQMLKNIQNHQKTEFLDADYLVKLEDFVQRFKYWHPEAYAVIEGGILQTVNANCNLAFNLWDDDNEKEEGTDAEEITYENRQSEWNQMIADGTKNGELKTVM